MDERRVLTAARTGTAIRNYTSTVTRLDGETRFLQMNAVPVFGPDGRPSQVVCSFVDFTERKRAEEQLAYQAHHDPLTGLPNRKLLLDRLRQTIVTAQQAEHTAALLLVDLDRFKAVNDNARAPHWRRAPHSGGHALERHLTRSGHGLTPGR